MPDDLVADDSRVLDGATVYLVEDDIALRKRLVKALNADGLRVFEFGCAEDLLSSGIHELPAVVVADMVLPGLSGLQLAQSLRQSGVETPVVFISGYSEPHQIIDSMKLGASDFLWKPFKSAMLLNAVRKALVQSAERHVSQTRNAHVETLWNSLSGREQDVCRLMLKGHGNSSIGVLLNMRADTASKHRIRLFQKMGVANRTALLELLGAFPQVWR